jgi:hypothetical protein
MECGRGAGPRFLTTGRKGLVPNQAIAESTNKTWAPGAGGLYLDRLNLVGAHRTARCLPGQSEAELRVR